MSEQQKSTTSGPQRPVEGSRDAQGASGAYASEGGPAYTDSGAPGTLQPSRSAPDGGGFGGAGGLGSAARPAMSDVDETDLVPLLPPGELEAANRRWREIQTAFVDDPHAAVGKADALVGDVLQQLMSAFDTQRAQFDAQWVSNDGASTEDLRVGLQRYRSFFHRLLSVHASDIS